MTAPHLLDVNVLVALAWPNHVHHGAARSWFARTGRAAWATTPVSETGFVRVSSNPTALPTAVTPADAMELLDRMRDRPGHVFLPDDVEAVLGGLVSSERVVAHRQVTDAHLLAVAQRHGARLTTFDRGLASLGPAGSVVLLPAAP